MIPAAVAGVTALAMLVPATPPDAGPVPPPAANATVQVVEANGSGCPTGIDAVAITPDNTRLVFYYNHHYFAAAGASALPTERRKNCRLMLDVTPPDGYTYAITAVKQLGYAHLEAGASGSWQAVYHFDGDPAPVPVRYTFTGPLDDIWATVEEVDPDALVWAPCDTHRSLVITGRLDISAGTSDPTTTSFLSMDAVDISPNDYRLAWRPC